MIIGGLIINRVDTFRQQEENMCCEATATAATAATAAMREGPIVKQLPRWSYEGFLRANLN